MQENVKLVLQYFVEITCIIDSCRPNPWWTVHAERKQLSVSLHEWSFGNDLPRQRQPLRYYICDLSSASILKCAHTSMPLYNMRNTPNNCCKRVRSSRLIWYNIISMGLCYHLECKYVYTYLESHNANTHEHTRTHQRLMKFKCCANDVPMLIAKIMMLLLIGVPVTWCPTPIMCYQS